MNHDDTDPTPPAYPGPPLDEWDPNVYHHRYHPIGNEGPDPAFLHTDEDADAISTNAWLRAGRP